MATTQPELKRRLDGLAALRADGTITDDDELARLRRDVIARYMSSDHGEATLKHYFEESELRQLHRWRAFKRELDLEKTDLASQTDDEQKDLFTAMVKNQLLDPFSVFMLTYILFGNDADRHYAAGLLLRGDAVYAIVASNFHIASMMSDHQTFFHKYGDALMSLPQPIFPGRAAFASHTQKLLAEYTHYLRSPAGGSGDLPARPTSHTARFRSTTFAAEVSGGEPWFPVVTAEDGTGYVDMAYVGETFTEVRAQIDALQAKLSARPSSTTHRHTHTYPASTRPAPARQRRNPRGGEPVDAQRQQRSPSRPFAAPPKPPQQPQQQPPQQPQQTPAPPPVAATAATPRNGPRSPPVLGAASNTLAPPDATLAPSAAHARSAPVPKSLSAVATLHGRQFSTATNATPALSTALTRAHQARVPPTAANATLRGGSVYGGDITDCLSDVDLDALLGPLFASSRDVRLVKARSYYDARNDETGAAGRALRAEIHAASLQHACVLVPAHTRHHWALAVFPAAGVQPLLLDSAPSCATRRDWRRQFALLGLGTPTVCSASRQVKMSNECGLHVIYAALRVLAFTAIHGCALLPAAIGDTTPAFVSLRAWRLPLGSLLLNGLSLDLDKARALLQSVDVSGAGTFTITVTTDGSDLALPVIDGVTWSSLSSVNTDTYTATASMNDDVPQMRVVEAIDAQTVAFDEWSPSAGAQAPAQRPVDSICATHVPTHTVAADVLDAAASSGSMVDAMLISAVVTRMNAALPRPAIIDTMRATALLADASSRVGELVAAAIQRVDTSAIIVHLGAANGGHYVCIAIKDGAATLLDSLPIGHASRNALRRVSERLTLVAVEGRATRQDAASNDCSFHAMRNAWRHVTKDVPTLIRELGLDRSNVKSWKTLPLVAPAFTVVPPCPTVAPPTVSRLDSNPGTPSVAVPPDRHLDPAPPQLLRRNNPYAVADTAYAPRSDQPTAPHSGHPSAAPPPSAPVLDLPLRELRRMTKTWSHGALIRCAFTYDGEYAEWAGIVRRPGGATPGLPATVVWCSRRCHACDAWHPTEDSSEWDVPFTGTTYHDMQLIQTLPVTIHECDHADSEAGSDFSSHDDDDADGDATRSDHRNDLPRPAEARRPIMPSTPPAVTTAAQHAPDESEPFGTYAPMIADTGHASGFAARRWFVFKDRPPHVHLVTWHRVAASTRSLHRRWLEKLRDAPAEVGRLPFPLAAIESVMRLAAARGWRWSTTSSALSAVAAAVRALPLYTNQHVGVDLMSAPAYADAVRNARAKARIGALEPVNSRALTIDEFISTRGLIKDIEPWTLLTASWALAARVGDMRRVRKRNVAFGPLISGAAHRTMTCTFLHGKGASCWGPYSVTNAIPLDEAKLLEAFVLAAPDADAPLWTESAQRTLSQALGRVPSCSLRSIRKGALVWLSSLGVPEPTIQQISGHRRKDTLLRYLGWGRQSSDAAAAAAKVSEAMPLAPSYVRGGSDTVAVPHPTWMGPRSGFAAPKGRRQAKPPSLFPSSPPSRVSLGLRDDTVDMSTWPILVKDVGSIDLERLVTMVRDPDLRSAVETCRDWTHTAKHYGVPEHGYRLHQSQIPFSRFTRSQIEAFYNAGKITPHIGPIMAACKGFATPQPQKMRFRGVVEPMFNHRIDKAALPPIGFLSRLQRRLSLQHRRLLIQFDFSAWYDQIPLGPNAQPYYVIRVPDSSGILVNGVLNTLFAMTKTPMGASWSAHVAQTVTCALLEPITADPLIATATMLDNIAMAGDDPAAFIAAVRLFLRRCDELGVTLNDRELYNVSDADLLALASVTAIGPTTFLGEVLHGGAWSNTERNVRNAAEAFDRLERSAYDPDLPVTRRNVASAIGALTWLSHTLQEPLAPHYAAIRLYSEVARMDAGSPDWDSPWRMTPAAVNALRPLAQLVAANRPCPASPIHLPSDNHAMYDVTAFVDASSTGWGALVHDRRSGAITEVRCGWRSAVRHSAWAEPTAAKELIQWLREAMPHALDIALVTDHEAMFSAQRRTDTGFGAASTAWHLNEFFRVFYETSSSSPDVSRRPQRDVFFVAGQRNPADLASRSSMVGDGLRSRPSDDVLPSLASCRRAAPTRAARPWWSR